jgi:hypothetical protein
MDHKNQSAESTVEEQPKATGNMSLDPVEIIRKREETEKVMRLRGGFVGYYPLSLLALTD